MLELDPASRGELEMYRFLLALDDAIQRLMSPQEITQVAAELLGTYLKVNRCAYAHVDDQLGTFTITGDEVT